MANAFYQEYMQNLLAGTAGYDLDAAEGATGVFVALIDTAVYTFNQAHEFYSDLSGTIGTPVEITTKTVANGTFNGDDVTFTAVTGDNAEALVLYRHNAGANTTWPLICFIDTGVTGLPVLPNGGDIICTWNASGIFKL